MCGAASFSPSGASVAQSAQQPGCLGRCLRCEARTRGTTDWAPLPRLNNLRTHEAEVADRELDRYVDGGLSGLWGTALGLVAHDRPILVDRLGFVFRHVLDGERQSP